MNTIATSITVMIALIGGLALLLTVTKILLPEKEHSIVDDIDQILPQIQCGQCGYPGCRPYAEAIASGEADINQCPPGGNECIRQLATLLDRDFRPLNEEYGKEKDKKMVALIDESVCIGCTLCIQACPVDAIVGAAKQMHTVIQDHCTGCELCISPCPVDCINMIPLQNNNRPWKKQYPIFIMKSQD